MCSTYLLKSVKTIQLLPILLLSLFTFHVEWIHGYHSPKSFHQSAILSKEICRIFVGNFQANRSQLGTSTVSEQSEIYCSIAGNDLIENGVGGGGIKALAELEDTPFLGQTIAFL